MGEFGGDSLVLKRELLGWKHPRAKSISEGRLDEEGDDRGEMELSLIFVYLLFPL